MTSPDAHSPPTEAAVLLQGVSRVVREGFWRRPKTILSGLDLSIAAGSSLALVGPNGSGKSTLLRVIAGVDDPQAGTLSVLGGSPRERRVRARVGWMPEGSPFPPELKPLAALELLATLDGMPRAEARERGRVWLERVGLASAEGTRLGKFSRGMTRRFGLAQAWLGEPRLLLLDEPTAGLDVEGLELFEALMDGARADGVTVVHSTHLAADVQRHAQRVAVMLDGRLAAHGATNELLAAADGERGAVELEVAGLDAAGLARLERELEGSGARLLGARPSQASLGALVKRLRGKA